MEQFVIPALLGFAGATITALVAWFTVLRQRSGKIDTTEADVLWAEGKTMREELRDEAKVLREEITMVRAELAGERTTNVALRAENELLKSDLTKRRREAARLRRKLAEHG